MAATCMYAELFFRVLCHNLLAKYWVYPYKLVKFALILLF